jgi:hypothetical protein
VLVFAAGRSVGPKLIGYRVGPILNVAPVSGDIQLGNVKVGEMVERHLTLFNKGDERLLISDVKSTCQCTVSELSARSLSPGAFTEMTIAFTAVTAGAKRQEVMLRTNDAHRPTVVLRISANAME